MVQNIGYYKQNPHSVYAMGGLLSYDDAHNRSGHDRSYGWNKYIRLARHRPACRKSDVQNLGNPFFRDSVPRFLPIGKVLAALIFAQCYHLCRGRRVLPTRLGCGFFPESRENQ